MLLPSGGNIVVGNRTSINQYCVINGYGGVSVGSDVLIAAFTSIYSSNHVFVDKSIPIARQGLSTKGGVRIEHNVWIGAHSVILDGVSIGEGSVVAAGSVVTSSLPAFGIYAGVPAKLIKKR
jgi:acetyltransferase-like isoleucine patch superfamily enzyme